MLERLKKLNPEKNILTRSFLYSVGFWGSIHIISSTIQAISRDKATGLNALRISNINAPVDRVVDTPVFFIGGWVIFWLGYYLIYRYIKPHDK